MSDDTDDFRHAYHACVEASKRADARWGEVDRLKSAARALRSREPGERLDDVTKARVVADLVRLDGDDAQSLAGKHDAYVSTLGAGAYAHAAARLQDEILDEIHADALGRYSRAAASHAAFRVQLHAVRTNGVNAHRDDETSAIAEMNRNLKPRGEN